MKRILILLLSAGLTCQVFAQEGAKPTTRISRDTMLIGDQIEWVIDLSFREGDEFFVEKPDDQPAPGVETISPMTFDTVSQKKGVVNVRGTAILTAFDSGSYFLPPLVTAIGHTDGSVDTVVFDSPVMEVTTIPVDTATFKPYDIKGQIRYPLTPKEIFIWVGLALFAAALVFLIIRLVKARRENTSLFGKPVVKDPPHIVALRSLDRIRSQKLWQNDKQKQFYTAVTDTLRLYISERYDISALESTSAEIFEDLKDKGIEQALYAKVQELFETADYVKFAKHNASDLENEEAVPTAIKFVNETYMQQIEADSKEEK